MILPKIGDLVHVREYARTGTPSDGWLSVTHTYNDKGNVEATIIMGFVQDISSRWLVGKSIPLDTEEDVMRVVPESEWPDEVCVALAKWRLSQ